MENPYAHSAAPTAATPETTEARGLRDRHRPQRRVLPPEVRALRRRRVDRRAGTGRPSSSQPPGTSTARSGVVGDPASLLPYHRCDGHRHPCRHPQSARPSPRGYCFFAPLLLEWILAHGSSPTPSTWRPREHPSSTRCRAASPTSRTSARAASSATARTSIGREDRHPVRRGVHRHRHDGGHSHSGLPGLHDPRAGGGRAEPRGRTEGPPSPNTTRAAATGRWMPPPQDCNPSRASYVESVTVDNGSVVITYGRARQPEYSPASA